MSQKSFRQTIVYFIILLAATSGVAFLTGLSFDTPRFSYWLAGAILVSIAAGAAWFYIFIHMNNRMLRSISALLAETFEPKRPQELPDTIDYIRSAVKALVDQASTLHTRHRENHHLVKRQIFLNLLEGSYESEQQFQIQLDKQKLNFHGQYYLLSIVEIDGYASVLSKQADKGKLFLQKQMCRSAIQQMAVKQQMKTWTDWIDDRRLGVLFILQEPVLEEPEVQAFYEGLRQWVEDNLIFTVTVVLGLTHSGAENVKNSYYSAMTALSYKPSLGINRLIAARALSGAPLFDSSLWLQSVRDISRLFFAGDPKWFESMQHLRNLLGGKLLGMDDLHMQFQFWLDYMQLETEQMHTDIQSLWHSSKDRLEEIMRCSETMGQMIAGYSEVLERLFEEIGYARESRHNRRLLQSIAEFIETHCQETDFSLAQVSEAFELTQNYLSRIIKEGLNVKFIDYVTRARMEKAKQLLLESTELNIGDVAEKVGYLHAVTFIRTFKKYTGSTPGNFRKDALY